MESVLEVDFPVLLSARDHSGHDVPIQLTMPQEFL